MKNMFKFYFEFTSVPSEFKKPIFVGDSFEYEEVQHLDTDAV